MNENLCEREEGEKKIKGDERRGAREANMRCRKEKEQDVVNERDVYIAREHLEWGIKRTKYKRE